MASIPADPACPTFSFRKSVQPRVRLSFFVKKHRRLSTPTEYIRKFVQTCVLPLILDCSPAIFPGLLKHELALLKCSIKLISQVSGLSFRYLTNLLCERHIKASSDFAVRILGDHQHPYTMGYQRQGHIPPPEAVLSCCPRRLLYIGSQSSQRYHDSWLKETQSWTITYRICLEFIYPIPLKFVKEEAENFIFLVK